MMKFELKMNSARPIRYGAPARALCEQQARRVAATANGELKGNVGKGFVTDSKAGQRKPWGRWRVSVTAVGPYAKRHNAIHNTLVRALK